MNPTTIARGVILLLIVFLAVVAIVPLFNEREYRGKEIVESETLACVVETCVTDKTLGQDCIELKPKLSKIRITVDENRHNHVHVIPTEIDCR